MAVDDGTSALRCGHAHVPSQGHHHYEIISIRVLRKYKVLLRPRDIADEVGERAAALSV